MGSDGRYFEQYVHLAEVTPDAALISWGGFWFRLSEAGGGDALVDDADLDQVAPQRRETIGARSSPFGHGVVEVRDSDGNVAGGPRPAMPTACGWGDWLPVASTPTGSASTASRGPRES